MTTKRLSSLIALCAMWMAMFSLTGTHAQSDTTSLRPDWTIQATPSDAIAFSPDGERLATGGRDNIVRLFETRSGELETMLTGHEAWVTHLGFSPDGSRLISAGHDRTVRIWDLATHQQIAVYDHHNATVTGVTFSPGGRLVASGSMDGTIWIGTADTGETLAILTNYSGPVWSLTFSPDGSTVITGSEDGTIWLWSLYDSAVNAIAGDGSPVTGVAVADDGMLATSHWDGSVRLWDIERREVVRQLDAHDGPATGVALGHGGEVFSVGLDGTVRLWDRATGWALATLQTDGVPLSEVVVVGSPGIIAAAGLSDSVALWDRGGAVDGVVRANPPPAVVALAPTVMAPQPIMTPTIPPLTGSQQDPSFIPTAAVIPTRRPSTPVPARATPTDSLPGNAPTAEPAVVVAAAPPAAGTNLSIPTANIFSGITSFPLGEGTWQIDPWEDAVGHFQGTAWVGQAGNIVLGGHSEYPDGSRGIFNGLYGVNIGDPIYLTVDGEQRRYTVTEKRTVRFDDLSVVYPATTDILTLITCDIPSFDSNANVYWERLVVVAVLG